MSNSYIDYLNKVLVAIEDALSDYQTRGDKSTGEVIKQSELESNWKLVKSIIITFEEMEKEKG